ncbi:DUF1622 domain-containing protein [Salinispora arenicola]|uniref:DUF1622 domain-containing protein n=1 Tax=Salinispora arenicola TaxID=168697 RepID=UPI00142F6BF4|nr:DUF1622 domain-containing protein [Salinispora arenicola]NIL43145.1 DUF1622 domain-containing protein [Salinispora arenicola]
MNSLIGYAVLACVAAGIGSAAIVLLVTRDAVLALRVGLELWLAASLLRLAQPPMGEHLLYVAAIIVIRQLLGVTLTAGPRWRRPADPGSSRHPPGH